MPGNPKRQSCQPQLFPHIFYALGKYFGGRSGDRGQVRHQKVLESEVCQCTVPTSATNEEGRRLQNRLTSPIASDRILAIWVTASTRAMRTILACLLLKLSPMRSGIGSLRVSLCLLRRSPRRFKARLLSRANCGRSPMKRLVLRWKV